MAEAADDAQMCGRKRHLGQLLVSPLRTQSSFSAPLDLQGHFVSGWKKSIFLFRRRHVTRSFKSGESTLSLLLFLTNKPLQTRGHARRLATVFSEGQKKNLHLEQMCSDVRQGCGSEGASSWCSLLACVINPGVMDRLRRY